ncbi:transcriptional pleiotropic regulator of transition state genes [Melghirimyces profundicolus]|uniref:Transcriptional pleiotropic regulator of transition state genes n=1 Tax=Melghirimyces profundicolus TaxID=1242148 RepID=A0A2T6BQL8_9BACL|nr:AbrB/MazE/SpoVT family DNA-binding domain-containing protein [Melghirimyces profundicolus]PTX58336.1 transcriptional pleiotropic regulator of transition state genes [Melghirimyces profundicolus]
MKATGIVRKVDELGRIVLPVELRRTMDIDVRDPLEIYVDGSNVILKKYSPSCLFCGRVDSVVTYRNKNVCEDCLRELATAAEEKS